MSVYYIQYIEKKYRSKEKSFNRLKKCVCVFY